MKRTDEKLRSLSAKVEELKRSEQLLVEEIMEDRAEAVERVTALDKLLEVVRPERDHDDAVLRHNGGALESMPH